MRTFERQVEKIANQLKTGNMDMAILRDKFIQIGWWSEEREIAEELHIQAVEIVNDYFNEKIDWCPGTDANYPYSVTLGVAN